MEQAPRKILYLGWIGFGNLGDDMMWQVFRDMAARCLPPDRYAITPSLPGVDIRKLDPFDVVVLGGGSLLVPGYIEILTRALASGKRVMIWGTGLDWRERDPAAEGSPGLRPGSRAFPLEARRELAAIIDKAYYTGVRGPLTRNALLDMGADPACLEVSGDPGLALDDPPPRLSETDRSPPRGPVLGINWGTSYNRVYGGDEARVEDALVSAAGRLVADGWRVLVYAVWGPDRKAAARLRDRISGSGGNAKAELVVEHRDKVRLADVLSRCDLTVNFKLHANVMSAIAGTPFIPLGYRFKVFDLAASLGLERLVVPTDSRDPAGEILARVPEVRSRREEIRADLRRLRRHSAAALKAPLERGNL